MLRCEHCAFSQPPLHCAYHRDKNSAEAGSLVEAKLARSVDGHCGPTAKHFSISAHLPPGLKEKLRKTINTMRFGENGFTKA